MPKYFMISRQNCKVNATSQSDTMSIGSPCCPQMCCTNALATAWAGFSFNGTKSAIFVNWSTTTQMVVHPSDSGSPVTKSIEIDVQGDAGSLRGCSSPLR